MKQLLFVLMLFLVSCGSPELSTPAPTQEAISVFFPPALKPWADKISGCASSNPLVGLYFIQSPTLDANINNNEISFYLGEPTQINSPSYLSQMGWEQIMVIVNQDKNLSQLSIREIQSVYSGQSSNWDNDVGQPIQVWVLPYGDPVRMLFDRAVLQSSRLTSEAMLAPDPEAMLEAIASDANAIGYLPGSALSSIDPSLVAEIKVIQLEQSLQDELHPPVIAITQNEPEGLVRELLLCVQATPP